MLGLREKGLSPIGVLLVVCNFAFFVVIGLKITPHYLEYSQLKQVFSDKAKDSSIQTPEQARVAIDKQLTISSIRSFDLKESAYFTKDEGELILGFEYEVREKIFGNVDVVLSFEYESGEE